MFLQSIACWSRWTSNLDRPGRVNYASPDNNEDKPYYWLGNRQKRVTTVFIRHHLCNKQWGTQWLRVSHRLLHTSRERGERQALPDARQGYAMIWLRITATSL
jgi:hypothetical protein